MGLLMCEDIPTWVWIALALWLSIATPLLSAVGWYIGWRLGEHDKQLVVVDKWGNPCT